jgi:hypothetical protein
VAFTYVTITHIFETAADVAATGTIEWTPIVPMRNGHTVIAAPVPALLSGGGQMSVVLAANTDPGTTPAGTIYKVVEKITGQPTLTYYVQIPHDQGSTLNLADLTDWAGGSGGGGSGTVETINGEAPDGFGNVVVSASDVGAQPAEADLTGLAALNDGYPRRVAGAWSVTDYPSAPRFITPPQVVTYGALFSLNAATSSVFRLVATGDTTLAAITGGVDGQIIALEVIADGGPWQLAFADGTPARTITADSRWIGSFLYDATDGTWTLDDDIGPTGPAGPSGPTGPSGPAGFADPIQSVILPYSTPLTIDARAGDVFRVIATGDLVVSAITNGVDGQVVVLQVQASGSSRTLTIAGASLLITATKWWSGELRYLGPPVDVWLLAEGVGAGTVTADPIVSGYGLGGYGSGPYGGISPAGGFGYGSGGYGTGGYGG